MRIQRVLWLCAALAVSQIALAKLPFSNEALGKTEAIIHYCVQANPQDAAKYEERKKMLVKNLPEEEVAYARGTPTYIKAHDEMSAQLEKVSKDQAVAACSAYLNDK